MTTRKIFLFLLFNISLSLVSIARISLTGLQCEGMDSPLGISNTLPHFSWKILSDQPATQTAYEIEVATERALLESGKADLWAPGKIFSDTSVMIPYAGKPLISRQLCWWRVRVTSSDGTSAWSTPQRFSIGIVDGDTIKGKFISLLTGQSQATVLYRSFKLKQAGQTAFLHVNSLGYHELYINGMKVTDAVLTPAVSQLNRRSNIITYDITSFLHRGKNSIVLWIGSGWYKKNPFQATCDGPAVRADLDILSDGRWSTVLYTDSSWKGCLSGYTDTGNWTYWDFGGENIDAAQVPADFSDATLATLPWQPVKTVTIEGITATPQMCGATIIKETLAAVKVEQLGDSCWLVDMGKDLNGLFEIHLPSLPAGQQVTASYGDHLNVNGSMADFHFKDVFISSGSPQGDTFRNRFNHHSFRYVTLTGLAQRPEQNGIKAHRIGMDVANTATFQSSDHDLNSIHDMLTYTMDNLTFCGYMVDCAHIERLGYGGDGNASTLSLQNNYDVAPLYMNWLQAWTDSQRPDGGLPHTAPNTNKAGGGPYWCSFIIQAPWRTWMSYGDDRPLHLCYPAMKHWLDYVDAYTVDGLLMPWPETEYRHWYLGDWLAPHGVNVKDEESINLVNNCVLSQSYAELIAIADYLGKTDDKAVFERRRADINKTIHERFFHADTYTYGTGTQLDMSYPLLIGIVPDTLVGPIVHSLLLRTDTTFNNHLAVGLVGVPVFTEWATLAHQADLVYRMLKQNDYPGYLYMIRNGATATWENWDDRRSYIHNCYNGMDSWFIQALGGIIPVTPGYKTTLIDPQIPEGLDWVRVTRDTPYGTICVSWERTSEGIYVHTVIPNGITAIINGKPSMPGTYNYIISTKH